MSRSTLRAIIAVVGWLFLCAGATRAEDAPTWPTRAITLVVAFSPGTAVDLAGRAIAQNLSTVLHQPVIVENRAGSGGVVGSVTVAKAPADGYTLLMTGIGPAVLRPLVDTSVNYDPVADFTPIILVGDAVNVLATSPKGFASVADVVAYAKANPGKLTIGHSGAGTMGHLIALLFAAEAGFNATFVGYPGSSPLVTDLAGGHIATGVIVYAPGSDATKILAVGTQDRVDFLPTVPTLAESGYPKVVGSTWNAIFAPAGLPGPVAARLNAAIAASLAEPELRKRFAANGYRLLGGPASLLRDRMADDRTKWSKVIAAANLGGGR
jgi:tripartite-type tricarboxylate transporter receptor subunit TctC